MNKIRPYDRKSNMTLGQLINDFFERPEVLINKIIKNFNVLSGDLFKSLNIDTNILQNNINETADAYIINLDLKGFNKEQIDIQTNRDYLTVKAFKKDEMKKEKDGMMTYSSKMGHFEKSYSLENVNKRKISAVFKNGMLEIVMPKVR
ncbi:Hsp20/alpha crystallin family protein [Clostridiaceae bacterium M8S5]|nr:Hsp20/alpha crystallin family protein [Clostridiaceae bacterium M8S5]